MHVLLSIQWLVMVNTGKLVAVLRATMFSGEVTMKKNMQDYTWMQV